MQKLAGTLKDNGAPESAVDDHAAGQASAAKPQPVRKGAGAMKFTFSSGSRPLDGYTIKRGIGVGGFGEVYFATSDAGKEVALKHIQRNLDVELRGVTQCLNLKHTNLVDLFDIRYDDEGEAWVVMEYVAGESLKDVTERHPDGMPQDEVDRWLRGIVAGVGYLHDHGIVHRDLKPGNIFLDGDVVKIGDYGLSKFISCSRRSGQTESVGTFHYMAPEIGKGVYGKEIDIYAIGIILHEMLTGRVPFDGESSQEIIMKHLTADPDLRVVPERYRGVIRRALIKDPQQRFACVADLLASYHEAGQSEPVTFVGKSESRPAPAVRIPPVVRPAREAREPIYIMDEGEVCERETGEGDIVFGSLRDHSVQPVLGEHRVAFQCVRQATRRVNAVLSETRGGGLLKIALLLLLALLLVALAQVVFPLVLLAGAFLLIYVGVRTLTSRDRSPSAPPRHVVRRSAAAAARAACRLKPTSQRLAEVTGGLLQSAIVCALLGLFAVALAGQQFDGSITFWSFYVWIVALATLGSWSLLVAGKRWELSERDLPQRRLWTLAMGVMLGLVAFLLGTFLDVEPLYATPGRHAPQPLQITNWYGDGGTPLLPGYLAYFGALMFVPRWWRAVDPVRRTRVSLLAAAWAGLWAWLVHLILYFPQPAGAIIGVTMSLAAQSSASWWNLSDKEARHESLAA